MRWWYRAYFTYFNLYADKVWYDNHDAPKRGADGQLGACGNAWYYFQYWLASPKEQLEQATAWDPTLKRRCRVTSVMAFTEIIHSAFGPDWKGPTLTVPLIEDA